MNLSLVCKLELAEIAMVVTQAMATIRAENRYLI